MLPAKMLSGATAKIAAAAIAATLYAPGAFGLSIKLGVYEQKPEIYIGENGQAAGILGELIEEIARREGWQLELEKCNWADCMRALERGDIDMLSDVFLTPERATRYGFHHTPALHSWSKVYAISPDKAAAITDMSGFKVAVLKGATAEDFLRSTAKGLGLDINLVTIDDLDSGFAMVRDHQADAVVADYYAGELLAQEFGLVSTSVVFQPTQAFYAMHKGRYPEVLAAIDRYLSNWQATPGSYYYQVLDYWRPPKPSASTNNASTWILMAAAGLILLGSGLFYLLWRRQKQIIRSSNEKLLHMQTILESTDAMVCIKDQDFRYIYLNRPHAKFLGISEEQAIGKLDQDLIHDQDSVDRIRQADLKVVQTRKKLVSKHVVVSPGSNTSTTFLTIKAPVIAADGSLKAICVIATDITERLQIEAAAYRNEFFDSTTGLPNRRMAIERLEQVILSCQQNKTNSALLLLNLDDFKKINEIHGHSLGDKLLIKIAHGLGQTTHGVGLLARTAADEFILILGDLGADGQNAAIEASRYAEQLRELISAKPFVVDGHSVRITVRIGVSLIHPACQGPDGVMREVDVAIERAKHSGGNQIILYEQRLQAEYEQRLWLERDLLQSINTPQLTLHLQPQLRSDGRVTGAELLARWHHPSRGQVAPSVFIPIAEETGIINLLGASNLSLACRTLITLQELGETYPLSVNISPRQLMEPEFVESINTLLQQNKVPGNRLIFEITEGILIQDIQAVAARMQELALLGIRFSIDDFGTGYSNLAYLKRLPLYELKIDRSLVQDLPEDEDSCAIVQMILAMAEQLGLRVVAEGVETRAQSEFLYEHKCHAQQGFLHARPGPIEDWLKKVRAQKGIT